jgi:hypothetical protein
MLPGEGVYYFYLLTILHIHHGMYALNINLHGLGAAARPLALSGRQPWPLSPKA